MPDVFLSYSRDDQTTARRFAEAFERAGLSVWWDQTLTAGEAFDEVTERALEAAMVVVVLWSRKSVASRWVRAEATQANELGTLMPVMIEPCKRPIMFELTHTADLAQWEGDDQNPTWQTFLAGVRRSTGRGTGALTSAVAAVPSTRSKTAALKPGTAVWVAAALAAIAIGAWWLVRDKDPAPTSNAVEATSATAESVSLAVLPFEDLSPNKDQEYFSDGLAEEILNELAQLNDLQLVGRTSSFSFKGRNEDLRVIAQKLGVGNLLEGSVRKEGANIRINAQLINGRDGTHRWSKVYQRELSSVFALQEEVARDVAQALSLTLDVGEFKRAKGGTTNLEAYDRYLQAHRLRLQGGRVASERAVPLLREAVAFDPEFARAWRALAAALQGTLIGAANSEGMAIRREAEAARTRADELMPDDLEQGKNRVGKLWEQRDWAQVESEARVLRDRFPPSATNSGGASLYSALSFMTGRLREAITQQRQMQRLEPQALGISQDLQVTLESSGQSALSEEEYRRSLELEGDHQRGHFMALVRMLRQEKPEWLAVQEQFQRVNEAQNVPIAFLEELSKAPADRTSSVATLRKALQDSRNREAIRMEVLAILASAYGDKDTALDALRISVTELRDDYAPWNPLSTEVRSDPRFKALVRERGLSDYWRTTGNWSDFCEPVGTEDFECH